MRKSSMFTSLYPKIDNEEEELTLLDRLKNKFSNETLLITLYNNLDSNKSKQKEFKLKPKSYCTSSKKQVKKRISLQTRSVNSKELFRSMSNPVFFTQLTKEKENSLHSDQTTQPNFIKFTSMKSQKQMTSPPLLMRKNYSTGLLSHFSSWPSAQRRSRNEYVNVYPTRDLDTILNELYSKSNLKYLRKHPNGTQRERYAFVKSKVNDIHPEPIRGTNYTQEGTAVSSLSRDKSGRRNKTFKSSSVIDFQRSVENLNRFIMKDITHKRKAKEEIENEFISIQDNFSDMKKVLSEDKKLMKIRDVDHSLLAQNLRFNKLKEKIALFSKLNSNMVYQLRHSLDKQYCLEGNDDNIVNEKSSSVKGSKLDYTSD